MIFRAALDFTTYEADDEHFEFVARRAWRSAGPVSLAESHSSNLTCEALEHRQLLSADSAVTSSTQLTAQPSLTMIPLVSNGPSGYSPQQIQTAYGVNEIKFSGGTVSGDGGGRNDRDCRCLQRPDDRLGSRQIR